MLRATAAGDGRRVLGRRRVGLGLGRRRVRRPRRCRFDGVNVSGCGGSVRRRTRASTVPVTLPERRPGHADHPVRRTAAEAEAGADAAVQDRAWRPSGRLLSRSPRWRSLLGAFFASAVASGAVPSWRLPSSLRAFLAAAFLPSSWPVPSWPAPSWPAPSWRRASPGRPGSCAARPGARRPASTGGCDLGPLASADLGGDRADRGGGRADGRADHLLAGADRVLHGPATVPTTWPQRVSDVLDLAERVLAGPRAVLPERGN